MIIIRLALSVKRRFFICFFVLVFSVAGRCEEPSVLVSAEKIAEITDDLFYDGSIEFDIDGDGRPDSALVFSYSKIGPASTCKVGEKCKPQTTSIITAHIDSGNSRIQVNFMCGSIGLFTKKTMGLRDIFCGPNTRLKWDGRNYVQAQE